jgi:hypothetical protein
MGYRKVYVNVTVRLIIQVEEGISLDNVMSDMDYEFTASDETANVIDTEITEWQITDSK